MQADSTGAQEKLHAGPSGASRVSPFGGFYSASVICHRSQLRSTCSV